MRTEKIELRVTADQKAALKAAADREHLTLSGFVLAACETATNRAPFLAPEEIDCLDQLREQLRRAGVNLNTLLRDLQAYELGSVKWKPEPETFTGVKGELDDVLAQIRGLLQTKV